MSDYWKSTPKYWCDHCKIYVRDTKLEKTNHESTAKHQSNLSRFLRTIHKENEREEQEKQRAKDEVARLTGNAPANSSAPTLKATASGSAVVPVRQATAEERKRQIQQLAAMGVAVPDQFRKDMAMAGDWEVIQTQPPLRNAVKKELDIKQEESKPTYPPATIGTKRAVPDTGLDEEVSRGKKKIAWGSATISYKDATKHDDLDALLSTTSSITKIPKKESDESAVHQAVLETPTGNEPKVKVEPEESPPSTHNPLAPEHKPTPDNESSDVVFKKRRSKTRP